jgi:multicomponent Na+:H+ antiporter subunit D
MVQVLLMGVCGAFLTGGVFNLYVWFEVMLMASFVLMVLGGHRDQLGGAIKYVTLNLLSSALFLAAVGILYSLVGTLNMADLSIRLGEVKNPGLLNATAALFLVAFGIKAAAFPLFFWLPDSYPTPPVAVSALFAGLLTKVGVYAMIRVFSLIFVHDLSLTHGLILIIAALTMVTGVLGAYAQGEFRKVLSFHIVSQIGYMIMGLGFFTPLAVTGAIYFIAHNIFAKMNLFMISGVVRRLRGSFSLKQLGGLWRDEPMLCALFLISALSLAGLPPLSGFFAKLILVKAGLKLEQYALVAVALAVSLITLLSMIKIWNEAFWKPSPGGAHERRMSRPQRLLLMGPVVALAAMTLAIGVMPQPLLTAATTAAEQLLEPADYIHAVMEAAP